MFDDIIHDYSQFNVAITSSIVATIILAAFNSALYVLKSILAEQRYRAYVAWWLRTTIIVALSLLASTMLFRDRWVEAFGGVCFVGLVVSLFKLYQLARIGIYDFDASVRAGFAYKSALRASRHSIAFLGTGASKLTSSDEFDSAIARCQMGVANRFLLIHPNSVVLKSAAKQAGVSEADYSNKVRASIERLARLVQSRGFKIEVRFQDANREDDLESFRLMFIDDRVCLFSFNAYGRGDGSALPQLIVQSKSRREEERTFYYGLQRYYERRWAAANPWDMAEFTGDGKR